MVTYRRTNPYIGSVWSGMSPVVGVTDEAEVTSHRGLISLTSVLGRRRWRDGRRADGSTDTTQTDED